MNKYAVAGTLLLGVLVSIPIQADAWWNLWIQRSDTKEERASPPPSGLEEYRETGCQIDGGTVTRSGETSYMRGTSDPSLFNHETRDRLAAIRLSGSATQASELAAPLFTSVIPEVRLHSRITLARFLIATAHRDVQQLAIASGILMNAELDGNADALYLRAALAMIAGAPAQAREFSQGALDAEPTFYDAAVVHAISSIWEVTDAGLSCDTAFERIATALTPVLQSGACPTHVAFFDLATQRLLPPQHGGTAQRDRFLQQLALSYVAKNDATCLSIANDIRASPDGALCSRVLETLRCADDTTEMPE